MTDIWVFSFCLVRHWIPQILKDTIYQAHRVIIIIIIIVVVAKF